MEKVFDATNADAIAERLWYYGVTISILRGSTARSSARSSLVSERLTYWVGRLKAGPLFLRREKISAVRRGIVFVNAGRREFYLVKCSSMVALNAAVVEMQIRQVGLQKKRSRFVGYVAVSLIRKILLA